MSGLVYPELTPVVLIGSKSGTTITEVPLPASYDAVVTKTFETGGFSELVLDISYTMGAAETTNSIEIKLEDSVDRTNFYRLTNESASSGTSTLTAREFTYVGVNAANAKFSYRLDVTYKYMKISIKETGVAANAGTVFVEGILGGY